MVATDRNKSFLDKIFYKLNLKARIHSSNSNLVCILIFVLFLWCGVVRQEKFHLNIELQARIDSYNYLLLQPLSHSATLPTKARTIVHIFVDQIQEKN